MKCINNSFVKENHAYFHILFCPVSSYDGYGDGTKLTYKLAFSMCAHITHCIFFYYVLAALQNSLVTVLRSTIYYLMKCHQMHTSYSYKVINVKFVFTLAYEIHTG